MASESRMSTPTLTVQLLTVSILSLQRQMQHANLGSRTTWNTNYDFIVVGAGGAGAIVASRLSQNSAVSVLLLEAGGSPPLATDIPANYYDFVGNPQVDWNFPLAPQPNLGQAYTMPAHISVGKVLGGSTIVSGMVYNRGNRRHFDAWDNVYGCRGWNWSTVFPYFLRSEDQRDPIYLTPYHNTTGPITVTSDWPNLSTELPAFKDYLDSAQMAGLAWIDPNGPTQNGVTLFQHTIQNGSKVSSASAYLVPAQNRSNLHILTQAYVTGIVFDGQTATGVRFTRAGQNYTVTGNREIILSAGTIGSAQILLLSGVGPSDHLADLGIPVVSDLPVGNNLHDHSNTILYFDLPNQNRSYEPILSTVQNLYNYYVNADGPLTMFPNAATYLSTSLNDDPEWPDIMTEMVRANQKWSNLTYLASMYQDQDSWADFWKPYYSHRMLSFDVQMVRPRARGTLRLRSTNPTDYPSIDPNYLGNAEDVDAMVDGINQALTRLTNLGPFAQTARFIGYDVPGCARCPGNDRLCDSYLRCFIRQTSVAVYRHVGTCRCGQSTDANAVVDERLRVINVRGLRVVDSSIMPEVVNANSWIATAMIGEYGAQMIRDDNVV